MAFAKLRIHTETTLKMFESTTILLGQEIRRFRDKVCPKHKTVELPREETARIRRNAAIIREIGSSNVKESTRRGRMIRYLNLDTYKFHSLGDYPEAIRKFGTTDSYSTQLVSNTDIFSYEMKKLLILQFVHRVKRTIPFSKGFGKEQISAMWKLNLRSTRLTDG